MAVRYLQTGVDNDLPRHPTTTFDDDAAEGWWGGVFQCGVQLALSAALLVSGQNAVARDQWTRDIQDPAGNLHQPANEDYWQNPTAPVPATLYQPLPLGDPELVPAGNLHQPANEDYWQNPTPPVPATLYQQLPLTDIEQVPAGGLRGQPDEDFWWAQLLPPPVPATLQPLYLPDPEEIPAGTLHGQPDEDFWINPAAPVPATLAWPQQWTFDEQFPVLYGQFDEDFWINPVAPVWSYPVRVFTDDDIIVPQPITFQPDEDFWNNPAAPVQASLYQNLPYLPDAEEIPAGTLQGQYDEDFWQPPAPWPCPVPTVFSDDEILPQPVIISMIPDEDFWFYMIVWDPDYVVSLW